MPARKIPRSINEAARDKARAIAKTEAFAVSRRQRKKVEMLFAHLKRILGHGKPAATVPARRTSLARRGAIGERASRAACIPVERRFLLSYRPRAMTMRWMSLVPS
jgi:hypothetical protein